MPEPEKRLSWGGVLSKFRWPYWCAGMPALLILTAVLASYLLDEPLRAGMERRMNGHLKGYTVKLSGLHLNPIGLSLTLKGLTVLQIAHPQPPVVQLPVLKASILWREVLSGKLVAALKLDSPRVNINLQQLHSEAASAVTLKEHGWQKAIEDIYPLKINTLKVSDASVTYVNDDPTRPLALTHLNLQANNIRNIHLPDQVYPSSFHVDTAILGTGRGSLDGAANFLGEPYPGLKGRVELEKVPIDKLKPLMTGSHLSIRGGVLGASGEAEYGPKIKTAHLEKMTIEGMNLQYAHSPVSAAQEKKRVKVVAKLAKEVSRRPGLLLRADQVQLTGCTLGYLNDAPGKKYRLFLADTDLALTNFSNDFAQGPAQARLKAKFMGSGVTTAALTFRPAKGGRDLDLQLKIDKTQMTALNDLLRAYGNFDVSAGVFSLVSELRIKNDSISGYLKPFFSDMQVYDKHKDRGRSFTHKAYEVLVGAAAKILENRQSQDVATKVNIKGSPNDPQASSWQIVAQLLKNAFFKAILPGFEKEAGKAKL